MRRKIIVGVYTEHKRIVVRKFEVLSGIRMCLDEQYALNKEDAGIIKNGMINKSLNFQLN